MSSDTLSVAASGAAADAIAAQVPQLVQEKFASRLFAQDPTLWGPAAEAEASKRLSWVGLARSSRPLVEQIETLRKSLQDKGVDHVVLCGMGGSSLAPEVICATAGKELVVLDSSQPDMVRDAVATKLDRTVVVVSSKSGSTVETDSQRRIYEQAFTDAGIDPAERIVVVTDPGSPLDQDARGKGYTVINADPDVGGRYSALTAFGLVPSGLAGVDLGALLDEAEAFTDQLAADDAGNPGLQLGAALGGTSPLRDKILLIDAGTPIKGFGDWAEQLIAESTGKDGKGLLPVVVGAAPAGDLLDDELWVRLVSAGDDDRPEGAATVDVGGSLGASLLLWEVAVAVAGRLIGINPFDQPDVESAKQAARDLMGKGASSTEAPAFTDGAVEVRTVGPDFLGDAKDLPGALQALIAQLPDNGYLAVMAYLDRITDARLGEVREGLARTLGRPVTFGWGPRFLHSTGQYHKGGPGIGVYLQITTEPAQDLPVPGRDFTLGEFIASQAAGDAQVLGDHDRPVLRLHLTDHDAGLAQVEQALRGLTR
ncbi:glucose-6-phosphate isomerase [Calidifontibacter sp. DB0510]|uniref:Glucose-6-phosphate isomerase n=1 Tax=Metallococcus carri TaxID=1656884 RepID=A0A967EGC7_9MICO|nr:glucose-6-phosphate isomerase [Metallococcus carri]NHN54903.1 glucose-6-phosphate isomerase [Metallococcus carri]NOP37249.1 glucose-6-phosphate isomerase [Calidifontibacter sp. DB2511S]